MHESLRPGAPFPDLRLEARVGTMRSLSEIAEHQPLVLCFSRGWWCPKEQVRLRTLVAMQEEIQREYGRICVVTTEPAYVNAAFRAGLGADFPFLADASRTVARELDLLETTDRKHRPFIPFTFVLDSRMRIERIWCGFWYWGHPTPEELRQTLREITRREQPTFDPQAAWAAGEIPLSRGIDGRAIWIREDPDGNEISRGAHDGPELAPGDEHSRGVDGRRWLVRAVRREGDRVAYRLRKEGTPDPERMVRHDISAPTSAPPS